MIIQAALQFYLQVDDDDDALAFQIMLSWAFVRPRDHR